MRKATQSNRLAGYLLASTLGLLALAIRLAAGPWPVDDAYITFRYARNLTRSLGLVYNPGQPVLGTSTPAFALLLALLTTVTRVEIVWIALVINATADGVSTYLLYRLARRLNLPRWAAIMCSLSWAFYPLSLRYAVGGMETSLVSVTLLASFALYLSKQERWGMALAGLAILTRPDALAAAAVILLSLVFENRRLPWRSALILIGVLLPWLLFATLQYGNPLPQSLQAKSHAVYLAMPWENAFQILYQLGGIILSSPMGLAAKGITVSPPPSMFVPLLTAAFIQLVLWRLGVTDAIRMERRWSAFFAFPLVFCGTYTLLGLRGNLIAEWYLVPLTPFVLLGVFSGLARISRQLTSRVYSALPIAIGLLVMIAQISGLNLGRQAERNPWVPLAVWTEREEIYVKAAEFLVPILDTEDVVAASEIGALGYYCDCNILDTVGLVSPEALTYYPVPVDLYATNYAVPPTLIRDLVPAYFVTLEVFIRHSLMEAEWFQREYKLIWETDTQSFGSQGMLIFAHTAQGQIHELPRDVLP